MNKTIRPATSRLTILQQVCNLIPGHVAMRTARATGIEKQARTFDPWSHLVTMIYAQLSHALSLNDVCDGLAMNAAAFQSIRGAHGPSRNGLSHANQSRDAQFAEQMYWWVLKHLNTRQPGFGWHKTRNFAFRFKRPVHLGGCDRDSVGGQLHGLGQAPAAQSRRQMSLAAEPAEFSAGFRVH